jgi:hypothetical protein
MERSRVSVEWRSSLPDDAANGPTKLNLGLMEYIKTSKLPDSRQRLHRGSPNEFKFVVHPARKSETSR